MRKPPLTLFGWPGALGGSETKLTALGKLLSSEFAITWVPNDDSALRERSVRAWIAAKGMKAAAWSRELKRRWPGHRWGSRWELLAALAEKSAAFLRSLDALVYDVGPRFSEVWGRAMVEGMLSGAVPLIPANPRHRLHLLVPHGVAGFHNKTRRDWRRHAQLLQGDVELRRRMSRTAAEYAREELCNAGQHRTVWRAVLG